MMKNRHRLFDGFPRSSAMALAIAIGLTAPVSISAFSAEDDIAQPALELPEFDVGQLNSQIQTAIQRAKPACVAVGLRRGERTHGTFSAVIVSPDGHVITAGHCIRPGTDYTVFLDDGRRLQAEALGRSTYLDCGLIKILEPTDLPWTEMGKSSELVRHQPCLSISHPGGHDAQRGLVVRFGHVLDIHAKGHIHNTCLMEPGDSGGGLFDLEGRVIGIHSYIHKRLSDNFDIPVDSFRDHWDPLRKADEFNPPHAAPLFGISLKSNRATDEGAEVKAVLEGSPAADAGLQIGDWITAIGPSKVADKFRIGRELRRRMALRDRDLTLEIRRDEEPQTIIIKRHLPPTPRIKDDPSANYDVMTNLAKGLSQMEELLDDCTVKITSTINEKELSLLGTVFRRDGLIVSKSSRVGESPTVVDHLTRTLPATVVARDEDNDLVLLQVDGQFERTVDSGAATEHQEGAILVSPRPGAADGLVSVVGSQPFPSPKRKQIGYLGVMLDSEEDRVILRRVDEGPAKQAGLKSNDVVLKVNEIPITTVRGMIGTIGAHKPGQTVRVLVHREDAEQVFDVTLTNRPRSARHHIADEFPGGSSLRSTGFEAVFCHDAHAEPQECGGPVFDASGNLVGLNIARCSRTHCYALPAELVRESVKQLQTPANGR